MSHHHDHAHGDHGHHHHTEVPDTYTFAFMIAISANLLFTVAEFGAGLWSNSVSLMADSAHNLADVLGLILAMLAAQALKKKANSKFTYGYRKASILSALINALVLYFSCGLLAYEAVMRLIYPEVLATFPVMVVAVIGILINISTALLFAKGAASDINIKGAFLHLLYDGILSLGVVIVALIIYFGISYYPAQSVWWYRLDPLMSLFITVMILKGTWSLLRDSFTLTMDGVPKEIEFEEVQKYLMRLPEVFIVHDLHIWALSSKETAMTCHVVLKGVKIDRLKSLQSEVEKYLKTTFDIQHSTIQWEFEEACGRGC